ncbi:MAG: hypothetical protein DLM53_04515 [Candidatus Eremiobacter antarcticus]|nr:diguanylate cyclase [Candidatus Eremiobacteraeota bacterium]MBC5807956.1 diguanylate cyclase [Candidatus Eremiobacteraeota bacterium]PZR62679.1 MAG: hypothetical protein DLM53_04515 [Candidatus Eremiobacter sp. RRmetagenome_bin22]
MANDARQVDRLSVLAVAGTLGDTRRKAAETLAASALGLLECDAAEVYLFDESTARYESLAREGASEPGAGKARLAASSIDDLFAADQSVLTVDDCRLISGPLRAAAEGLGAASLLGLRLRGERGRALGLVLCAYRTRRELSAQGSSTAGSFNRIGAAVFDLARRTEGALDRADRLAALLDSAARFAGELDLDQLFAAIHEEVARHMDSTSFYVALQSGDLSELRTEYAVCNGVRLQAEALPEADGAARRVFETGFASIVESGAAGTPFAGSTSSNSCPVLIVPMRLGNTIIGVMATQAARIGSYGPQQTEFLLEVAEQAATAIANAGVLREERRRTSELTMLHRLAVLTSSETALDRIMEAVVIEAASIFRADAASIALEDERGEFQLAATFGLSDKYSSRRRLSGKMLRDLYGNPPRERFLGPEQMASLGQPELQAAEGIRSIFLIPLTYRGILGGSLALHGREGSVRLSSSETRLAQVFADQVAASMHRARAAQRLAERIEDYDLLARVGHALVSTLQVDYERILRMLRDQLGYQYLTIFSVREDPAHLHLEASLGYGPDVPAMQMQIDAGLVGAVATRGEMLYIPDVRREPRYLQAAEEVRSFIAYPLKLENTVLGLLSVESASLNGFAARDRRLLAAIVDQTAVALSNARQYATATESLASLKSATAKTEEYARYLERRQQELELIGAVGTAVSSSLDLDKMLSTAAEKIAVGMRAQRCIITLYDDDLEEGRIAGDYWGKNKPSLQGERLPIADDWPMLRILGLRSLASDDAAADRRFDGIAETLASRRIRGCAAAAIVVEGQVAGTVTVASTSEPRIFSAQQLGVLETIATQLALGVRNARLYGRARERANEDSLTGLFNHRYLHGRLEQEIVRAARSGEQMAVVMFDLNDFKGFNDTRGHQAGDDMLRLTAEILRQSVRASDLPGRYGGDEFMVILPASDLHGARLLLERVRRKIAERVQKSSAAAAIELSAGIAVYPFDGDNKRDLIAFADAAMYAEKPKNRALVDARAQRA